LLVLGQGRSSKGCCCRQCRITGSEFLISKITLLFCLSCAQLLVDGDAKDGRKSGGYSLKPGALDRASAGSAFFIAARTHLRLRANSFIGILVASGRFTSKKSKDGRNMEAGVEGGSFAINVDDARFSSIFTGAVRKQALVVFVTRISNIFCLDPNYAVDPLNPLFQRTPGMQQVLQASQSKRLKPKALSNSTSAVPNASAGAGGMSAELKLLVSSVKSKAPRV
jgi:hypothetical protein